MTRRLPCPEAPGPLEGYAARFDDLFGSLAQRLGFRECLAGLLAPRDRNKTLTALAGRAGGRVEGPGGAAAAVLPVGVAVGPGPGQHPAAGAAAGRSGDRAGHMSPAIRGLAPVGSDRGALPGLILVGFPGPDARMIQYRSVD